MGFSTCHPAINLLYFVCVICVALTIPHPIFLAVSVCCAFAYCLKVCKLRGLAFCLALVPCVLLFGNWYAGFTHFGITKLGENFIGNPMTAESLAYGLVLGGMVAAFCIWMACVHAIFTADKVVYLLGGVSPKLSLFLAILLRMVPRIKAQARKISIARQGIGMGANQGHLFQRALNSIRIFSMLITWTIETMATVSESMRSRGSGLRGRTAYSIYRFDNRDRAFVVVLFACLTLLAMGLILHQGDIYYDPQIIMNPITPLSWAFYGGYGVFCLMPLGLDLWTDFRFRQAQRTAFKSIADGSVF